MTGDAHVTFKPVFIALYVAMGCVLLLLAWRAHRGRAVNAGPAASLRLVPVLLPLVVIAILLGAFAAVGSLTLLAASAAGFAVFVAIEQLSGRPAQPLAAGAGLVLALTIAWWLMRPGPLLPAALAAYAAVLAAMAAGLALRGSVAARVPTVFPVGFLAAGLLLMLDVGGYRHDLHITGVLVHHWGAYIGPALQLRAGLVPFFDMPLQYGLGPTLAIAAVCRDGACWAGTEALVIAVDLLQGLLLLAMALTTAQPRGRVWQGCVTLLVFAAMFLWPGYPAEGNLLLATPSEGGLRFLPVVLIAALLYFGRPGWATLALAAGLLWAPELAGMSAAVYGLAEIARIGLARAALRGAGVLAASFAALALLHRAWFGLWLEPAAFAEYVLHVPGALPIIPVGNTLLLLAMFGLGVWLVARPAADPAAARRDRVAVALLFATASYFLGRSHPNNVCNLMPFLLLVALRALDRPAGEVPPLTAAVRLGLAGSAAALALSPWRILPYDPRVSLDLAAVVASQPALEPDIEAIRAHLPNPDGLGIADFSETDTRHPAERVVWTPIDPSSLWAYVPSERRRIYIQRSAARLRRAGWAIFDDDHRPMAEDFTAGYTVAQRRDVTFPSADGGARRYLVLCLNPRVADGEPQALTGPACPDAT